LGKIIAVSSILSFLMLALFIQNTTPSTIGPLGILFVFILMYVSVLGVLTFLIFGLSHLANYLTIPFLKFRRQTISLQHSYYFASIVGLAPIMLIAMQSVGEITIYDVSLVAIFVFLGCIYISKRVAK